MLISILICLYIDINLYIFVINIWIYIKMREVYNSNLCVISLKILNLYSLLTNFRANELRTQFKLDLAL